MKQTSDGKVTIRSTGKVSMFEPQPNARIDVRSNTQ